MLASRIEPIVALLRRNGVVLLPTDTLFGLAGRLQPSLVDRIYHLKNRDTAKPLALLVNGVEQLQELVKPSPALLDLARRLLPGAVTCIFPGRAELARLHPAYAEGLAVRWLDLAPVNELLAALGEPLLLTFAKYFRQRDPTAPSEVPVDILNGVDCICFPGVTVSGQASALVDLRVTPPAVARSAQTLEQLLHD